MLNINLNNTVADNEIRINGTVIGMLTDEQATKLIDIVKGFMSTGSTPVSTPAPATGFHPAPEKKSYQPIPETAKKIWQDNVVTVVNDDKNYRIYISSFSSKARYQAKEEAKSFGAKWTGDRNKGIIHWTFPTKKAADDFIKARKEWAAKNPKEKA